MLCNSSKYVNYNNLEKFLFDLKVVYNERTKIVVHVDLEMVKEK